MADVSSEYWAYNDPRWANDPAYGNPETMKYVGPWEQVLQATGFRGKVYEPMIEMQPDPNGGFMPLEVGQQYTPQAKAAIDSLRASGYDLRWKHPDRRTFNTYYGLVTPSGEVEDIKIEGSDLGDAIMPMLKVFGAGLGLAGLGAGINSLLGGAGAGAGVGAGTAVGAANALTPAAIEAGLGTAGYGFNAGAAASGAFAPTAIGAGAALPFESILSSGGGTGALTASDLDSLPSDVLGELAAPKVVDIDPGLLSPQKPVTLDASGNVDISDFSGAGAGAGGAASKGAADITGATGIGGGTAAGAGAGPDAVKNALYGADGYGAGMTGAQTGAYDTVLGATGSKTAADVAANVVGAGGSILDKAIDLIKSPAGGALLSGVGSVVGGITQANAAEAAANQQAEAARNALQLQREMFEYQKGLLEPYRTAGTAALKRLEGALGLGGAAQPQQTLEMDPGYGFRLGEGMKALERMQSARGNMLSGGAMKAGQRYAQDYASGEYGNAYNRLANIAGLGQTTGTQLGNAASQFSTNAGNVMGQEANALAAGRIGRASAYGGAIQGGLNAYSNYLNQQQQNQLFRDIFGRTAIGG